MKTEAQIRDELEIVKNARGKCNPLTDKDRFDALTLRIYDLEWILGV
jgi:hypothetical protein